MTSGVKEPIALPGGQGYRLLRWSNNLLDLEVVLTPDLSQRLTGVGHDWHHHPAFELILFNSGEGTRFVGDHIGTFGPGDLLLIGEDLPHYWHPRGPNSGLCVQWLFPPGHAFWSFPESERLRGLFDAAARGIRFQGRTGRVLAAQMREMAQTSSLDRLGLLFRSLATAATAPASDRTFLSRLPFLPSQHARNQVAMREAMQYLLAHFRDEIGMEDLLHVTSMSKATFSRQFKKSFGRSLNQFLQQVRLEAACQELAASEHAIIDVALASGFTQISFFNRAFRRVFKCNPSEFRHRHRGEARTGAA